jgi:hypothetical protein
MQSEGKSNRLQDDQASAWMVKEIDRLSHPWLKWLVGRQ